MLENYSAPHHWCYPDVVRCEKSCILFDLPIELQIQWMDDAELSLDLYLHNRTIKVGPYLDVEVSTERGEKLPVTFFMSMPKVPHGTVRVRKGEVIRFPVYPWNGILTFPREGKYRLSVQLHTAAGNGDAVLFQTNEREVMIEFKGKTANPMPDASSASRPTVPQL